MDKITKALQKLNPHKKILVKKLLELIQKGSFANLDIKKLKGHKNIFRIRKGDIRIIFQEDNNKKIKLLTLENRSEKTYRNF